MLYIIGIGLSDPSDITLKGLEVIKTCEKIYLESYTSVLQCAVSALETLYGKKIILADRTLVEQSEEIVERAKNKNVAFLVIGDPFSATTHCDISQRAREAGVKVEIIHNASILTAIGETGLQLYKFGKVTSIPFENENVITPITVWKENNSIGMHTLFLLDLHPPDRFLSIADASSYLIKNGIPPSTLAIGCARLGSKNSVVKKGTLQSLCDYSFGKPPFCLLIPSKMHFMEKEAVNSIKS